MLLLCDGKNDKRNWLGGRMAERVLAPNQILSTSHWREIVTDFWVREACVLRKESGSDVWSERKLSQLEKEP